MVEVEGHDDKFEPSPQVYFDCAALLISRSAVALVRKERRGLAGDSNAPPIDLAPRNDVPVPDDADVDYVELFRSHVPVVNEGRANRSMTYSVVSAAGLALVAPEAGLEPLIGVPLTAAVLLAGAVRRDRISNGPRSVKNFIASLERGLRAEFAVVGLPGWLDQEQGDRARHFDVIALEVAELEIEIRAQRATGSLDKLLPERIKDAYPPADYPLFAFNLLMYSAHRNTLPPSISGYATGRHSRGAEPGDSTDTRGLDI